MSGDDSRRGTQIVSLQFNDVIRLKLSSDEQKKAGGPVADGTLDDSQFQCYWPAALDPFTPTLYLIDCRRGCISAADNLPFAPRRRVKSFTAGELMEWLEFRRYAPPLLHYFRSDKSHEMGGRAFLSICTDGWLQSVNVSDQRQRQLLLRALREESLTPNSAAAVLLPQVSSVQTLRPIVKSPSADPMSQLTPSMLTGRLPVIRWDELSYDERTGFIGSGRLKAVYRCSWEGATVALAVLNAGMAISKECENEMKLHAALRHPNIVTLFGHAPPAVAAQLPPASTDPRIRTVGAAAMGRSRVGMIMELMGGGSLHDALRNPARQHSIGQRLRIMRDIACGVAYPSTQRDSPVRIFLCCFSEAIYLSLTCCGCLQRVETAQHLVNGEFAGQNSGFWKPTATRRTG